MQSSGFYPEFKSFLTLKQDRLFINSLKKVESLFRKHENKTDFLNLSAFFFIIWLKFYKIKYSIR